MPASCLAQSGVSRKRVSRRLCLLPDLKLSALAKDPMRSLLQMQKRQRSAVTKPSPCPLIPCRSVTWRKVASQTVGPLSRATEVSDRDPDAAQNSSSTGLTVVRLGSRPFAPWVIHRVEGWTRWCVSGTFDALDHYTFGRLPAEKQVPGFDPRTASAGTRFNELRTFEDSHDVDSDALGDCC